MFKKYLFLTKETNSMKCKSIFFSGGGGGRGKGEGGGKGEMYKNIISLSSAEVAERKV